jgi:hypothetical protein
MKTLNYLIVALLFLTATICKAQQKLSEEDILKRGSLKMEALNEGQSKVFEGKYCMLNLTEKKSDDPYPIEVPYGVILFKKSLIVGAKTIQLHFERENQSPYIITIPNNRNYVLESTTNCDIAAISLGSIKLDLEKNKLIEPIFWANEDIPSVIDGVKESDLKSIKEKMLVKAFAKE